MSMYVCVFIIPILFKVFVCHVLFKIPPLLSHKMTLFPYGDWFPWTHFPPQATKHETWPPQCIIIKCYALTFNTPQDQIPYSSLALPLTTSFMYETFQHSSLFNVFPISVWLSSLFSELTICLIYCWIQGILPTSDGAPAKSNISFFILQWQFTTPLSRHLLYITLSAGLFFRCLLASRKL